MRTNYKKICANFLKGLPQRTAEVIERRFGLKTDGRETLESIGKSFGITRERVRQIEEEGFEKIRPKIGEYKEVFDSFDNVLASFGDIKKEDFLLDALGDKKFQNQIFFLLTLNKNFERVLENKTHYSFWTRNKKAVEIAEKAIALIVKNFEVGKKPLLIDELFNSRKEEAAKIFGSGVTQGVFASYLEISKKIQKNPDGQLGLKNWVEINPRGIKDKAYLVLKKEGKPLHFTQVSSFIKNLSFSPQKNVHIATVHNELIKDDRFVLVGRGLYALKEWGYAPGVVKDIICRILRDAKRPLLKKEIFEKVQEQRFVKENTVSLNLQDKNYFIKDSAGRYAINPSNDKGLNYKEA